VSIIEITGRIVHPRSENDQSIKDGNTNISPNVINVSITAWTIPNVCCIA